MSPRRTVAAPETAAPRQPQRIPTPDGPVQVRSRVTTLFRAAAAFWRHDLLEATSYPLAMVNGVIGIGTVLFLLYFGGLAFDQQAGDLVGAPWFLFAVVGWVSMRLLGVTLGSFRARIRRYQLTGLLEACVMTRTPLWKTLLVMPTWDLVAALSTGLVVVTVAFLLTPVRPDASAMLTALAVLGGGLLVFTAVGMISASVTLVIKHGDPVARTVSLLSLLVAGTYVPREVLPTWLAQIGAWLPMGAMLDGLRVALLDTPADPNVVGAGVRLGVLAVVLVPCALLAARAAISRVLRDGSLSHY